MVTAGFAKEVDEVKKYAEPIQAATATGIRFPCPRFERIPISAIRPAVAITSPISRPKPSLTLVEI